MLHKSEKKGCRGSENTTCDYISSCSNWLIFYKLLFANTFAKRFRIVLGPISTEDLAKSTENFLKRKKKASQTRGLV